MTQAKERLRPILRRAREPTEAAPQSAFVYLDMEHYDVKDLSLQLFRELLDEPEFADMEAGVVLQTYLKDAHSVVRVEGQDRALDSAPCQHGHEGPDHVADAVPVVERAPTLVAS